MSTTKAMAHSTPAHGLTYPQSFLDSLPVADDIPLLTAPLFSSLHYQHILSHPPDSVLFPFVHGIEGDNEAQNGFFANSYPTNTTGNGPRIPLPSYRGMMWVVCEDDLDNPEKELRVLVHPGSLSPSPSPSPSPDEWDDDESDESISEDEDHGTSSGTSSYGDPVSPVTPHVPASSNPLLGVAEHGMHLDGVVNVLEEFPSVDEAKDIQQHMHPVQHRSTLPSIQTDFGLGHERSTSGISGITTSTESESWGESSTMDMEDNRPVPQTSDSVLQTQPKPFHRHHKASLPPPILTSTFRASELLRRVPGSRSSSNVSTKTKALRDGMRIGASYAKGIDMDIEDDNRGRRDLGHTEGGNDRISDDDEDSSDGEWEFIPLHVPEGISLRNFGIQVPILASISDIIVYSPTPSGAAHSKHAKRLAKRFRMAQERLWRGRWEGHNDNEGESKDEDREGTTNGEDGEERIINDEESYEDVTPNPRVKYNTFILDATADDINKVMPHLVVRLWKEGEVPGSLSPSGQTMILGGGLNVASGLSSAPVLREGEEEGAVDVDQDGDIVMSESPVPWSAPGSSADIRESESKEGWSQPGRGPGLGPNTVDFAQREKDEMRDLTRASEIISVFPFGSSGLPIRDGNGNVLREDVDGVDDFDEDGDLDLDVGDVGEVQQQLDLDPDLSTTLTYFNPHIGQVFLGNANDVPLPVAPRLPPPPLLPSGPGQLPHPSSVPPYPYPSTTYRMHMEGDEEGMRMEKVASDFWAARSEGRRAKAKAKANTKSMKVESDSNNLYPDSVFPYPSPPPNSHAILSAYHQNPASSLNPTLTLNTPHPPPPNTPSGYDICIECHDLAPFPTYAHIKASEEKVWELEERWRRIVELERTREEREREAQTSLNGSGAESLLEQDGDHNMGDREGQATSDGSTNTKNISKKLHYTLPPRPTPHPNSIIHLPMPSSPPASAATMGALMPVVRFLEKCLFSQGSGGRVSVEVEIRSGSGSQLSQERDDREAMKTDERKDTDNSSSGGSGSGTNNKSRRWSSVLPSFSGFPSHPAASSSVPIETGTGSGTSRHRSMTFASQPSTSTSASTTTLHAGAPDAQPHSSSSKTYTSVTYTFVPHSSRLPSSSSRSSHPSSHPSFHSYPTTTTPSSTTSTPYAWSRPLKILLYSADGYTESSVPALCLLMALKGLSLPGAYLELQVKKKRSFFVYQGDLGILRRVEAVLEGERREREREERLLRERREREERERRVKEDRERERERGRAMKDKEGRPGKETDSGGGWFGLGGLGGIGTHINPYRAWGNNNPTSTSSSTTSSQSRVQPQRPDLSSSTEYSPARQQVAHILQQVQQQQQQQSQGKTRPAAKSVSFAQSPYAHAAHPTGANTGSSSLPTSSSTPFLSSSHPTSGLAGGSSVNEVVNPTPSPSKALRRPRASTSPWLPSSTSFGLFGGDHQSWFNDARFDGSFPSRVLPFLYLGNLAHASNVYMLQALGITHVVSVGECALVPPDHFNSRTHPYVHYPHSHSHTHSHSHSQHARHGTSPNPNSHPQHDRAVPGSLWIEERAGRIKVLDIQGICDDGIDTLEPQLEPICEWIDEARKEGGQVLVHCRVGVSRSATVVIAYVMKHLSLPLVDAYLIVRSRRLSVLIQPNMRLLYNLLGWEIKLAKERVGWIVKQKGKQETQKDRMGPNIGVGVGAGEDEYDEKLKRELASALSWPYLAKEVHKLNEKYLR